MRIPVQTGQQGWGKAQDSFLPLPRRSRLVEGRSYQTHSQSWPCQLPMTCYVYLNGHLVELQSQLKKKVSDELKATFGHDGGYDSMPVSRGYAIAKYLVLHSQ